MTVQPYVILIVPPLCYSSTLSFLINHIKPIVFILMIRLKTPLMLSTLTSRKIFT